MVMTRRRIRTLLISALLSVGAACVINTRPHLPGDDNDAGFGMVSADAGAAFDAGAFAGATDAGASRDDASAPAADGAGGGENLLDDCVSPRVRYGDGGDVPVAPDGGDAGFVDRDGAACDPSRYHADAATDASDASTDGSADAPDVRTAR